MTQQRGADRRVHETRTQLHDALASLVHEKPYDEIVVKEIVARAAVGRSTFYAHYRDKDELLDRGIRDLLRLDAQPRQRWTCATERILRFSLPFLEHVARYREHGVLPMDASGAAAIHDHLRRALGRARHAARSGARREDGGSVRSSRWPGRHARDDAKRNAGTDRSIDEDVSSDEKIGYSNIGSGV